MNSNTSIIYFICLLNILCNCYCIFSSINCSTLIEVFVISVFICKFSDSEEESSEEEEDSNEDGSSDSDDYEDAHKKKGVQGLIEIENPNRAVKKTAEKVSKIDLNAAGSSKTELSRREREELEKQRAQAHYQKLHAEGKTDQARADLARLAIIKQHRAEAAARREAEKKGKC